MKSYIPHRLLVINDQIVEAKDNESMERCYQLAFDWANRMGLEGKKVFSLFLERPDPKNFNPMRQQSYLWCKIECTEEERAKWDEIQKLHAEHAVYKMLNDE